MKTFACKVCSHIEFDEAPVKCPVCEAPIENFENNSDAIKKPADPDNLSEGDRKHIPVLVVKKECGLIPGGECIDVQVKVGEIEHVMETEHYITFIDFYIDRKYIARTAFIPHGLHPAAALHLKVNTGTLTAIENCNVHGSWMAEVDLSD